MQISNKKNSLYIPLYVKALPIILFSFFVVSCNESSAPEAQVESPAAGQVKAEEILPYKNTALDINVRVSDLVARMTIAEKIAQMYNEAPAIERLNVPAYNWWNESLHGVARAGKATVFPQAIGMAAMWDAPLMFDVATAISDEGRAKYHYFVNNDVVFRYTGLTFWSPNINIFRDPRWGRGQETYGEDPYLTGTLAVNYIKGLQGDDETYLKTAATAKHFAVHNGPEKTRHSDNYTPTNKDLYETYLPAFEMAVVDAKVEAVMCAYNSVNGDPACGSSLLLKDILRGNYQFDGHVMSDCGAIADFYDPDAHNYVRAPAAAAALAVKAGTDLNCGTGRLSTFTNLHFALQRNMITEDEIDTAVKRLFKTRFKLGMFDPDEMVPFTRIGMDVVGSEAHLALAQKASEESLVLLKNDGTLPLKSGIKVAVIGPNANNPDILVGNYNGDPISAVTPLAGIQKKAGLDNVIYAAGSSLIGDIYGHYEAIAPENFFHVDKDNKRQPGLMGAYYNAVADRGPAEIRVSKPGAPRQRRSRSDFMEAQPQFTQVDKNIDFYWEKSPVNNTVWDEFGIVWTGLLVPVESGLYQFQSEADVFIDGEQVRGSVQLEAGKNYTFKASRTFLRTWWGNPIEPKISVKWVNKTKNYIAEAVAAASKSDVIIFMGGISPRLEGEEMRVELDGFDSGDRTHIKLPQEQHSLLQTLHALGKPVVLVNFSGSAMALNWEDQNLNAIVQGFYPGEAAGTAMANLLWGDVNPSGRLPITFYKSVDDLPAFDDYTMENRTYKYYEGDVLYPFGHGLSYTDFSYANLSVLTELAGTNDLEFSVDLKNTGKTAGDEVTQVYLSLLDTEIKLPVRELKAFKRTSLAAGENARLTFTLARDDISFIDNDGKKQAYKGRLLVTVGSGQQGHVGESQIATATLLVR